MAMNRIIKRIIYLIIPVLAFVLSCDDKNAGDVKFSYQGIIDKDYRFNVGRVIPVTIGQAVETDGDISRDGKYFFYSSNSDGGNFDIYLRSMTDITTVRLTSHPSKDITPVISPNGKRLAFVSFRDDPEGDIFVMKIKPEDLIKKQEKSVTALSALDDIAVNISIERDMDSGVIINTKDANPVWSPDSRRIAYSSSKGGTANIWIMNSDGSDKKKLTEKGGQYPSFSMDGNKLVFVSYRENENGDLYILDINSGKEGRVTSDKNIKLYPSFMNTDTSIIYSSIESDTNKNGVLDLQDRSIIRCIDTKKGLSYPMTKKTDSSFKAKWLPVLSTRDYNGVIIYTDITGENINLNIIPEAGIIPKKQNARLQYEMCSTYLEEYDDREKYLLSLESVFINFGANTDNTSRAYVDRALEEAALYYKKSGESDEAKRIISIIKKRSDSKDIYASFILDIVEKQGEGKGGLEISSVEKKFEGDKNVKYYLPFALESIADGFIRKGDYPSALKYLNNIAGKFPDFERLLDIQLKISLCGDDLRRTGISDSAVTVLNKGNTNQKISIIKNLVEPFSRSAYSSSEIDTYLTKISNLKAKYKDDKKIQAVLTYVAGLLYDSKGSSDKSREELLQSITLSHPNDITSYLSNIKLGEIERRQSRFVEAEKYFSAGVKKYSRRFKTENFKERLLWLVNYYEQTGEKSVQSAKFKDAVETYDKLIFLVTLMHNNRLYPEVYTEYAPKAHILYIDAYTEWNSKTGIAELEKKYENNLSVYRMDFDRAAIYGLGYIYTKKALMLNTSIVDNNVFVSPSGIYEAFKKADEQVDWALFMDDTFIEPYILKSWIYQYIDLERNTNGDNAEKYAGKLFPKHLWEENLVILEKALNVNDESLKPENEGNLHLNMANSYFLLLNYPRALKEYKLAEKYKKSFGSDIEKALFHFHLGYSLWQNSDIKEAEEEIKKAYEIYNSLSLSGGSEKYKYQYLTIYRYFALFSREENRYTEAIEWYRKILKYAEDNKLTIDRARYYQELAYCYIKTGRPDSAKYNLDRAATMLEKYPDDERKYYLRIKLFGLGPFPVLNLGADAAVIGNNKIFYPLDTRDKKLLNLSLYEEIAVESGNYTEAIRYLKEKIMVLEEATTSVAVDARIRSLNNLGYYYYVSGKLKDAEISFNRAGDLAGEKSNLDGTKKAMMNLVNLYALMIEDNISDVKEWQKKISSLIGKIESYRKNYYSIRIAQETEVLEQKAEKKKEKVSEQELSEAKERIEQETVAIYYSLDVSASILKYYLAEILYASDPVLSGKSASKAADLYSVNRDIFNLYKEGIKSFESAVSEADKSGSKELKAKLLMNAASCYEKTGDYEKAYVSLLDANSISEKNSLSWVKINSCHKLGNFLNQNGREVEKTDSQSMADRYFSQAIQLIEEFPAVYSSHANRVKTIYNDYINFLIERGVEKKAFEIAERYSRVARIISISSLSPEFSNEYDRKKYYEYSSGLGKLAALRNELTSFLLSGADPVSKEIVSKKKDISLEEDKLKAVIKEIGNSNSSIKPYVDIPGYIEPAVNNNIFRFHETGKGLFYWKISKAKMTSGYVKDNISSILAGTQGLPVFILLSDPVIDMVNNGSLKSSSDYIFINTLDRIPYYLKDSNSFTGSIYSEENAVNGTSVEGVNLAVSEGKDKSFSDYSLIVDIAGSGKDITAEEMFSSSISPACIIQTGAKCDYQYLTTLMEGAFYAGTKRVIVTSAKGGDTVLPLVKKLYGKEVMIPAVPFFTMGYINTYNDIKADNREVLEREFSQFSSCMKNADFKKAAVHLARWNSLQKEKNSNEYIGNLWLMELLSGRIKNSLAVLDSFTPANDDEKNAVKIRKAYSCFYSGDLNNTEKELGSFTGMNGVPEDVKVLTALIRIIKEGDLSAVETLSGLKKPYKTVLPAERYIMPAAQYLFLAEDDRAVKISDLIPENPYLSKSEHLMRNIISGVKPPHGKSIRFDRIADLWNTSDLTAQRDEALRLVRGDKGLDELSVYPVLETLLRQKGKTPDEDLLQFGKSVNIEGIISKGDSLSSLILLKTIDDFFSERENYKDRVFILNNILKISREKSFNSVKRETVLAASLNYYLMGDYQQSYDIALSAEEEFSPEDKNYVDMLLLRMNLYIKSEKYKEAEIKGNLLTKMKNLSPDRKYMLNLQLSLLELHRLSSLKKASMADAAQFEKLFSSALSLVKHDTELLNRRGYRDMTGSVFEEFINYKMRTGQHTDAHYYNEVKKLLIASSRCGTNLFKYAGTIDIEAVQSILPDNGLYVNIAKIRDDLFVWTADKKSKKAFVIENGYASFLKTQSTYKNTSASGKDLTAVSKELANILSPLYTMMKGKNVILISPDSDSEKIPFEISGDGEMISDKSIFLYIPSLLVSSTESSPFAREIFLPDGNKAMAAYLGRVAIKESGAGFDTKPGRGNGMIHLSDKIRYNQGRREYTVSGRIVRSVVSGNAVLFAPSDEIGGAGVNDFLLSGRDYNLQAALMNSSPVQDTNNALFIEEFYRNACKGISLQSSFTAALNKVKRNSRYSYPSNWDGYRLNIYNLNLLKK